MGFRNYTLRAVLLVALALLVGIGVAVIGKVSGARAAIVAAIIFLLGTGVLLLQ